MGNYDFEGLSPLDFEELSNDLVAAELAVGVESFTPGPDGGIDGRFEWRGGKGFVQSKHTKRSDFRRLKRDVLRAKPQIDKLGPTRYFISTSLGLTPDNKDALKVALEPHILSTEDILDKAAINALLRKFPEVEKSHHKLWLHSSGVLSRMLNNATANRTSLIVEEIERANQVFVSHKGYLEAQKVIDAHKVLIVAGPPGVGKTTLSLVVASRFLEDDWDIVAVSSINEALSNFDKTRKQAFFFDDFLGAIRFDQYSLSQSENDFKRFISMIRKNPATKRFILTTRKYILAEARIASEALSDDVVRLSDVVIDLKTYSDQIKAKVLYNHLYFSDLDQKHINALVKSGRLLDIIQHKNYMPRLIEWLTDTDRLIGCEPDQYVDHFLRTLGQPDKIWEHAVTRHLNSQSQLLLFCLFLEPYSNFTSAHKRWFVKANLALALAQNYQVSTTDYADSLKVLEGSFVSLGGWRTEFINPSLQDFLSKQLQASPMLTTLASSIATQDQALKVWRFVRFEKQLSNSRQTEIYQALRDACLLSSSCVAKNASVCQFVEFAHYVLDFLGAESAVSELLTEDRLAEQDNELSEFPRFLEEVEDGYYEHLDQDWLRNYLSERFVAALEDISLDFDDHVGFLGEIESVSLDFTDNEIAAIDEATTYVVENTELPERDADEGERLKAMLDEIELFERWTTSRAPDELRHNILQRCNDIDAERAYHEEQAMDEYYLQAPVKKTRLDPTIVKPSPLTAAPSQSPQYRPSSTFGATDVERMFSSLIDQTDGF